MLQVKSSGSVKIISLNRDKLLNRLGEIAAAIKKTHPEVKEVRVFGSVARGDQVGTSDVDVLLVLYGSNPINPLEKTRQYYPFFNLPVGVDLLVYTEGSIADRLATGDQFMQQIWNESQVV